MSEAASIAEAAMPVAIADKELAQYRDLLKPPSEFKDGFGWTTVTGIIFCGLVMLPGSIYLGLMTGASMGAAATWVTVILFSEVMRRALKTLNKQQLVVLLQAAGGMVSGGVIGNLVFRAYLVRSDAVRDSGMRDAFPRWFVPSPDSIAITGRNLFHSDWFIPIALAVAVSVIALINKYTLGYFFFRLTSDIENLPFPLAPIQAQGAMALAEQDEDAAAKATEGEEGGDLIAKKPKAKKKSDRWRLFSLGIVLGIAFGFIQVGVPAITGLFLDKPLFLIPQPFIDTTTLTESILPATPTGVVLDLGIILTAMVIPYWAIIGSFVAIVITIVANPIMHHYGILTRWQPGMDTVNTTFANSVDFWLSFGIGTGLGIAIVSIFQTIRDVRAKMKAIRKKKHESTEQARRDIWSPPVAGRGDWPIWVALLGYVVSAVATVVLCYMLLPRNFSLLLFLIFFAFIYNPLISYVNARLLGIAGQTVDVPFIKETSFILSGARGIAIWLAPIPVENYGTNAQAFRVNELTGVSFWSLVKLDLVVLPVSLILSLVFWGFIWASEPIPSPAFPWAQINWELQSKNQALLFSATFAGEKSDGGAAGEKASAGKQVQSIKDSQFMRAIHPSAIGIGAGATVLMFTVLSIFGLPVMFVYGMIRGFGGLPHTMLLELVGALVGRFYFQKKYGANNFLRMAPTVLAGYFTGVGLIGMATIAMKLIQSAVSSAPF